jgi:cysteine-rich repeat protein
MVNVRLSIVAFSLFCFFCSNKSDSSADTGITVAAPTGLKAVTENGSITLSWNGVSGATAYNVYYATTSSVTKNSTKISGISGTTTSVANLTNFTKYYLKVTAVIGTSESELSSLASETPYNYVATCGNGVINTAEDCDDGNSIDTDTCSNRCRIN